MRAYGADAKLAQGYDFRSSRRWRKLRLVVLRRDRWTCQWCGGPANTVDHVIAVADGGAWWDLRNLVAACGPCNSSRSPGGRPGWHRGKSQSDGRTVRISHYGQGKTASLVPSRDVVRNATVSLARRDAVDAARHHLHTQVATVPPAQTGRPRLAPSVPTPYRRIPAVSANLGHPARAFSGPRYSQVVTSDYSRRTDGAG